MTVEDLGHEATELVSLANGEAKSLSKLAELAVRQVPGCAAAHVTIWRDGELAAVAASHPDPAELIDLEAKAGPGPLAAAVRLLLPRHLPFVVGLSELNPQALADRAPRDWLDPWLSLAAGHVLTQRERAMRALTAIGAQVILSAPRDFERVLFERYRQFKQQRRI